MALTGPVTPAPAQRTATPAVDPGRTAAVRRLLTGGATSPTLDALVGLAADLLQAPFAQVSLLAEEQVVPATAGLPRPLDPTPLAESLCTLTVLHGGPLVLPDAKRDAAAALLPPVTSGAVGAYLGVPLAAGGTVVGALCVFAPAARSWSDEHVSVLERLAQGIGAELELRAVGAELALSAARLDLALGAASVASFDVDLRTGQLSWDTRLVTLFGHDPATFVPHRDSFTRPLHPEDRDRVLAEVAAADHVGARLQQEFRVVLPDGRSRWVSTLGRVLDVAGGPRLVGAAFDSSEVREGRDRFARVLETMTDAFYSVDRSWKVTYLNARAELLLERTADELVGRDLWEEFPHAVGSDFDDHFRRAVATGETVSFEAYYPPPLDAWYEVRAWPSSSGLGVFFHDVTGRRKVEQQRAAALAQAQAAQAELALLAEMTRALTSTLEADLAADRLAALSVPRLGDWAAVTVLEDGRTTLRHADRELETAVHEQLADDASWPAQVRAEVLRTGEPVLSERSGTAGATCLMAVPLRSRGRVLGSLLLAADCDRRPYDEDDLATAVDIGRRAGLALDNAQLYGRQRSAAHTLQQHLLPALPEPDHLEIVARYRSAEQEAQVGGDFYWGALQPDGATVIAIGDVSGHDLAAISWQAQLAPLLRGFAYEGSHAPAEVLARVDSAMRGLQIDTMATAVVARVEQGELDRLDGLRTLRWSNAGHPPPLLLRASGGVEVLEHEPDLLLGLDPATSRADHEVELEPGDTLLLYTDGLVERRGTTLEAGLARLADALADLHDVTLDQLCDEVLARMLDVGEIDDDIAVLALRTHPEDRPRPVEAGPSTD